MSVSSALCRASAILSLLPESFTRKLTRKRCTVQPLKTLFIFSSGLKSAGFGAMPMRETESESI